MRFLAAVTLLLVAVGISQADPMAPASPGLFYVFASGQVVILDPAQRRVAAIQRVSAVSGVPFPNHCPKSPFRGLWMGVSHGPGMRSLISSIAYQKGTDGTQQFAQDVVLTWNATAGTDSAHNALPVTPAVPTFVPITNKVWLTTNTPSGSLYALDTAVVDTAVLGSVSVPPPLASKALPLQPAAGSLLQDLNLARTAFLTSRFASGVHAIDLYAASGLPSATVTKAKAAGVSKFVSFAGLTANGAAAAARCPSTLQGVYSRLLRHAFFLCAELPASGTSAKGSSSGGGKVGKTTAPLGMVQLDPANNTVVAVWPVSGDSVYITPDESFLLVLNKAQRAVHVLMLNVTSRSIVPWPTISLTYTPARLVFDHTYMEPLHYTVYIAYLDADRLGVLNFFYLKQAGMQGDPGTRVQDQEQMGNQNAPGSLAVYDRAIAAGGGWVCQAAVYDQSVVCFSPGGGGLIPFPNITNVQYIAFVPGRPDLVPLTGPVNPFFDCSTANRGLSAPPPPMRGGPVDVPVNAAPGPVRPLPPALAAAVLLAAPLWALLV